MIIALVRHLKSLAQTRDGFCYKDEKQRQRLNLPSDNDVPLTQQGINHGKRLQKKFAKISMFDPEEMDLDVSPYLRAVETAEILFPQYKGKYRIVSRLSERNSGYCAGMTQKEKEAQFPFLQEYWDRTNPLLATPPGGESMFDVVYRVEPVLKEAIAQGRNRCFVAHGNLFKAIDFILKGMLVSDFPTIPNAPNGSLTVYRNVQLGPRGMSIDRYQEVLCR